MPPPDYRQISQGKYIRFQSMSPLYLRIAAPYSMGLLLVWQHHPPLSAYIQFLFVDADLCRQLPSDSQSPTTPLLLANTPYCKACSGLPPYSLYTCLTHKKRAIRIKIPITLNLNPENKTYLISIFPFIVGCMLQ